MQSMWSRSQKFGYGAWVFFTIAWFLSVFPLTANTSATTKMLVAFPVMAISAWLWSGSTWGRRLVNTGAIMTFFVALLLNVVGANLPEFSEAVASRKPAIDKSAAIGAGKAIDGLNTVLRGESHFVAATAKTIERASAILPSGATVLPCGDGTFQLTGTMLSVEMPLGSPGCTTPWIARSGDKFIWALMNGTFEYRFRLENGTETEWTVHDPARPFEKHAAPHQCVIAIQYRIGDHPITGIIRQVENNACF